MSEEHCECSVCSEDVLVEGNWHGDSWSEPREFEPFDDPVLCSRCKGGRHFTITFRVVGFEDFNRLAEWRHWREWFDCFDSVYLKQVEIKDEQG